MIPRMLSSLLWMKHSGILKRLSNRIFTFYVFTISIVFMASMMPSISFEPQMIFSSRINLFHDQKLRNQVVKLELNFSLRRLRIRIVGIVTLLQQQSICGNTLLVQLLEFGQIFHKLTFMKYFWLSNDYRYQYISWPICTRCRRLWFFFRSNPRTMIFIQRQLRAIFLMRFQSISWIHLQCRISSKRFIKHFPPSRTRDCANSVFYVFMLAAANDAYHFRVLHFRQIFNAFSCFHQIQNFRSEPHLQRFANSQKSVYMNWFILVMFFVLKWNTSTPSW